jgi:hypothetical protein
MVAAMSDKQEARVLDAVGKSIKLANDGLDPSEAIAKVASDYGFNKQFTQRMVEAFNVSKSLKHHKEASGDDRAATFSLADPNKVRVIMFPETISTPAESKQSGWVPDGEYGTETRFFDLEHAPTLTNSRPESSITQRDPELAMKRAYAEVERHDHATEMARRDKEAAFEKLYTTMKRLSDHFRSSAHEPFENFEKAALAILGESVKPVMDALYNMANLSGRHVKRAEAAGKVKPKCLAPYQMLQELVAQREDYATKTSAWVDKSRCAAKVRALVEKCSPYINEKTASNFSPVMASIMANQALESLMGKSPSAHDTLVTAMAELGDPSIESERQSIRARSLLANLMRSDEVLSKIDQNRVLQAYNEIAAMAPAAAENPLALQSLLRKHVEQGQLDPSDISSIIDIEKGTRQLEEPKIPEPLREMATGVAGGAGPAVSQQLMRG